MALFARIGGYTSGEAIAYIGIPIMGGGMGAGAVPIANVFEQALGIPSDVIMGKLVPAVALGNAMAIVAGGMLDKLGKIKPSWTGNGQLMRIDDGSLNETKQEVKKMELIDYGKGIVVATAFFTLGAIISTVFKNGIGPIKFNIHTYAWMILAVAFAKATNIIPEDLQEACAGWYQFVAKNFTSALLLGIGIGYTELKPILEALTPAYFGLVLLVVIGAMLGSGIVGRLVGFHPIEAAITAGLCMANMGGTGDVAVLTASKRMELMPFAQISSRLGGEHLLYF